ncbi:hypothetical protein [Litoreibacter roseus]|uniref:Mercuric ion transport protein n=1 Tax=Litoreibacter roseus TaxID=2601869 RepID=A0A6N6JM05_9RHOB|nr:hypothetical protein [Litoreibacter roseus]GFE67115.1 hypothetical protein KIN_41890 [Litoreibacter roseus]
MRDSLMGGLLAFGVAAPALVVCCGGGTAVLAALFSGVGAWLSGVNGIGVLVVAGLTYLIVRALRRSHMRRASNSDPSQRGTAP